MKILCCFQNDKPLFNQKIRLDLYCKGYLWVETDQEGYFELNDELENVLISTSFEDNYFSPWMKAINGVTLKINKIDEKTSNAELETIVLYVVLDIIKI